MKWLQREYKMMPEEDLLKVPDPDNKKKKFEKEQVMLSEKFHTGDLVEYYYYDSEHLTHHFGIIVSPIELYYAEDDEEEIYANGNYVNIQKFDIYGNINWNSEPKKLYLSGKECYVVKPVSVEYMNDYLKNQFNDDIAASWIMKKSVTMTSMSGDASSAACSARRTSAG